MKVRPCRFSAHCRDGGIFRSRPGNVRFVAGRDCNGMNGDQSVCYCVNADPKSAIDANASASFSSGAHDEWNILRILNERRRGADQYGVTNQLPILFDGRALPPGSFEDGVALGYAGRCLN